LVVGAVNSGLAFLPNGYSFNEWLGLVLELGRLAALLGAAGLSVQIVKRRPWIGNVTRVIASLAVVFVAALIGLATLETAGILTDPIGVIGLVAYILSVSTFLVVGAAVVWTGSHSRLVGGLLLVNVVALLVVFFGRLLVPLNLLAAVVPVGQVLLYLGISRDLRSRETLASHRTPATDTTP
jgi:putative Mn2+ efflux pump MntP